MSATRVAYSTGARDTARVKVERRLLPSVCFNCKKLVKPIVSAAREAGRDGLSHGRKWIITTTTLTRGHSLSTECPSRRVCHCSPRFLTVHFLGHRETRCTHCKRPIVKHDRTKIGNEKNERTRKFVSIVHHTLFYILQGIDKIR